MLTQLWNALNMGKWLSWTWGKIWKWVQPLLAVICFLKGCQWFLEMNSLAIPAFVVVGILTIRWLEE